jgi:hypothetical protein
MTLASLVSQAYPSPEWAVFFEVANTTGFGATRRADAIALGIWPSRGNTLIGFEFKEDRRDWLREQKNPAKAEAIASQCDGWFVVAGHDGIVKVEELPDPWGLKVANKDRTKLLTVKDCQWYPDRDKTVMKRSFAASMLRKITETTTPKAELDRIVEQRVADALDRTRAGHEIKHLEAKVAELAGILETFKRVTGVDMNGWRGTAKIAAAVDAVLNLDSDRRELEHARKRLEIAAKDMGAALDAWPTVPLKRTEEAAS